MTVIYKNRPLFSLPPRIMRQQMQPETKVHCTFKGHLSLIRALLQPYLLNNTWPNVSQFWLIGKGCWYKRQMHTPPHPTPPRCILTSKAVDLWDIRGCHRKLWENVMDVIVKIEKTNTMTNTWGKTKTDKDKNVGEWRITAAPSCVGNCYISNSNCTQCLSPAACHQPLPPGPDPLGKKPSRATTSRCQLATVWRGCMSSNSKCTEGGEQRWANNSVFE